MPKETEILQKHITKFTEEKRRNRHDGHRECGEHYIFHALPRLFWGRSNPLRTLPVSKYP